MSRNRWLGRVGGCEGQRRPQRLLAHRALTQYGAARQLPECSTRGNLAAPSPYGCTMHLARATGASALALVLLGACSSSGDPQSAVVGEPAGAPPAAAETKQLEAALLTPEHLGRGFVVVPDEEDDGEDSDMGCLLTAFEELTGGEDAEDDEDDGTVDASWAPTAEPQLPYVGEVLVPVGAEEAREGVELIAESFEDCTEVDTTDDDGARMQLEVETDTVTSEGADAQVNVVAAGTMSTGGLELPFLFEIRMAAVGDNVVGVFLGNISEPGPAGGAVMDAAVERLVAVMAGETPPEPEALLEGELPDFGAEAA